MAGNVQKIHKEQAQHRFGQSVKEEVTTKSPTDIGTQEKTKNNKTSSGQLDPKHTEHPDPKNEQNGTQQNLKNC